MQNKLAGRYSVPGLLKFSLPTIVMMVFMSLYTMVDGIFVSRLIGTTALSAVNIVYPLVSVVVAMGIMLATGASAVVARKMGEGNHREARQDFTLVVITGAVLGLVMTGVAQAFLEPLLRFLGAGEATLELCMQYAGVLLWFVVPSMLQMMFQFFFVTAGQPGIGLAVTVLGGVANIVLDYVFIARFGWGIAGAAVATGIGYCIPALFGLCWFALRRRGTLFFVRPVARGRVLFETITNGSSEMVTNLSTAVITYLFNILMLRYLGEDGVAAITIVLYAEYLLTAIYLGYSSGVAPILSYNHGEGNIGQLRRLFRISMGFLLVCSAATLAGAMLFAEPVVGIFAAPGSSVFTIAVHGYYLYALCYLFKGVNIFASSLFTALSDGKTSALLSFLRTLVFIALGMALLPRFLQVDGIWLAVPFAELLSVALSLLCFRRLFRQHWRQEVELRPITRDNEPEVLALRPGQGQEGFIESTRDCLREARADTRWQPVAVYSSGRLIGFAMYGRFEEENQVWLDRFLIDGQYQGKGYGAKTLRAVIQRLRREYGCDRVYLSVYSGNHRASRMYEKFGFRRNGQRDTGGEEVMLLQL